MCSWMNTGKSWVLKMLLLMPAIREMEDYNP